MDTTLDYLADNFNQTLTQYTIPESGKKREYLLDINPWARQRVKGQGHNIIDARWIDIWTGLYIDITGLSRLNASAPDMWECKNGHNYLTTELYPLRKTTFEDVSASVPFQYDSILVNEYTKKALTTTAFHK